MFVQGKEVRPAKNCRQCIDLARVGLAVEVGQSELPGGGKKSAVAPNFFSHFPLRVRQPFWR